MIGKLLAGSVLALLGAAQAVAQEPVLWIESRHERLPPDFVVFDGAYRASTPRPPPDARFIVFPRGPNGEPPAVASAFITRTYDCASKQVNAPAYSAYAADGTRVDGDEPPQIVLDMAPLEPWQVTQWERDCNGVPLQQVRMAPPPTNVVVDRPMGAKRMQSLADATAYAAKKQNLVALARATPVDGDFVRLLTPAEHLSGTGDGWRQYALDLATTRPVGNQLRATFVRVREYYDRSKAIERVVYLVDCATGTAERELLFEYRLDGTLRWVDGAGPRAEFAQQTAATYLTQACAIDRKARTTHYTSMTAALGTSPEDDKAN